MTLPFQINDNLPELVPWQTLTQEELLDELHKQAQTKAEHEAATRAANNKEE